MSKPDWAPGADAAVLAQRARLLRTVREFFFARDVLEVSTPVLGASGVSDVHIENIALSHAGRPLFLQTSPEYFMKRLLASGSGAIYQIGPAFRGRESGARHNLEFTMLEWYRNSFSLAELALEVGGLLETVTAEFGVTAPPARTVRYKALFAEHWSVNPHTASLGELRQLAVSQGASHIGGPPDIATRNDCLDMLFASRIQPLLEDPVIVSEYPASQAALACAGKDAEGDPVAFRFELFWQGVELANGYLELRDAVELRRRMEENNALRRPRGLPQVAPDEKLLAALPNMLPCAGVALGVDRLLMLLTGKRHLDEVMAFSDRRL